MHSLFYSCANFCTKTNEKRRRNSKNGNKIWRPKAIVTTLIAILIWKGSLTMSNSETTVPTTKTSPKRTTIGPMVNLLNSEERLLLRQAFARKFGLETLIIGTADGHGSKTHKVPPYIWTLYENHSANPGTETIRHYATSAHLQEADNVWLMFNLSATGRNVEKELIVRAELHFPGGKSTKGTVHKVTKLREMPAGKDGIELLEGKGMLDVVKLIRAHPTEQEQLILTWSLPRGSDPLTTEHLENIALILFTDSKEADGKKIWSESVQTKVKRRAKRWVSQRMNSASKSTDASGNLSRKRKHRTHRKVGENGGGQQQCRRTGLYVDFGELNWHDWIIAPSGYEAYQCRGRCTHPLPAKLNTTNHAIVQSLIHSIDPGTVTAPSCVPVQMSAISILYKDINNVIVVKTYADMRVDACGCH